LVCGWQVTCCFFSCFCPRQLVKEAKKKTEEAKTSLRNMRKSALQKLKTNKGGLTDDEFHRISANVQTIFNDVSDQIDSMAKTKVKDLEK